MDEWRYPNPNNNGYLGPDRNNGEHCLEIHELSKGTWNDKECDAFRYFVCEYTMDIDECASSPCQNGGKCQDNLNSFTCSCVSGYRGETCSIATFCEEPWIKWDKKCFLFPDDKQVWSRANHTCALTRANGSHLAVLNSKEELKFVVGYIRDHNNDKTWLGCSDITEEGDWVCEGSESFYRSLSDNAGYWEWKFPNPDNNGYSGPDRSRGEHCLEIYELGKGT